jgi:predicted RNase H-like nuclease (RuvC/YqgF family)
MNAYELADAIEDWDSDGQWDKPAADMLRQQADRIAKLESYLEAYKTRVAELENQLDKCSHHEAMAHQGGYEIGKASQIKELSDEEILKEAESYGMGEKFIQDAPLFHTVKFAKQILKKASEK